MALFVTLGSVSAFGYKSSHITLVNLLNINVMRTTFNTQFYCRKSKAGKDNKAPLELSININGERKFINIPTRCDVNEFNKKRQPQEIRNLLIEWDKKIQEAVATLLNEGTPLTTESLRELIRTGGKRSFTIADCFNGFLKTYRKRVNVDLTYSAYRKYELTQELFYKHFNPNAEITTVTPASINDFYAELNKVYQPNSSASYMAKVKTVIQYAMDNGKLLINPFQSVKIKREKKDIDYLTDEELDLIAKQNYSTNALRKVADVFWSKHIVDCHLWTWNV